MFSTSASVVNPGLLSGGFGFEQSLIVPDFGVLV
jgi:hypothetical protein